MFQRCTAILFALLVLVSATGYNVTVHLCHGKAVRYALFGEPGGCGGGEETMPGSHCEHPGVDGICGTHVQQHTQCCINQSRHVEGIDEANRPTSQLSKPAEHAAPAPPAWPPLDPPVFASAVKPPLSGYSPPAQTRDLPVLLQVFRI